MRLIDADNVLKALGIFNDREHGDPHFLNGIETAREIVEQAPTVGGWISVKERMPEEHKLVLATDETFYVHVNWIVEGKWIRPFHNRITYWMAIPNLPNEGNDDD